MTIRVCLFVLALLSFAAAPTFGEYADWKFDAEQFEARLFDDWLMQDVPNAEERAALFADASFAEEASLVEGVVDSLETDADALRERLEQLVADSVSGDSSAWRELYADACRARRAERLELAVELAPQFVYTKHYVMGASHYAYTEDVTDEAFFDTSADLQPGSQLCMATFMPDGTIAHEVLVETPTGTIRDPDVSWDGTRVLFALRTSLDKDDFHLYEYDVATRETRQLTFGLGVCDMEPCYLPNGDLLFISTRCGQITDCWWTEVSNLYTCDGDGRFLRRVSVDQVTVNYPTVLDDGRVIYTRWDYNDRGHIYVQPLFQMNADGTAQTEFYGNNSYFPTAFLHSRGIPGSDKVVSILGGHHAYQHGKLGLVDRSKGTQGNSGVQLLAPVRVPEEVIVDRYGQEGELFQYPYPLDEDTLFVAYLPEGSNERTYKPTFGVYWFDHDGNRELLCYDPAISCGQPIPFVERDVPTMRPSQVDLTKKAGQFYVQDVYEGPGLTGIERGTVKALRVVALEYRPIGVGWNWHSGEAGDSMVSTPCSIGSGTWDVKRVLGEVPVEEDGSAFFEVPALTPVYFQLLDRNGDVVQTMRSWSTLQPGETFACVGCHEPKGASIGNVTTASGSTTMALRKGVAQLAPVLFPGEGYMQDAGFSYLRDVQPILDKYCVSCHSGGEDADGEKRPFSLMANDMARPDPTDEYVKIYDEQKRIFADSYVKLTHRGNNKNDYIRWLGIQDRPSMLPPYYSGAALSPMIAMLRGKEHMAKDADLPKRPTVSDELYEAHKDVNIDEQSLKTIAMWIDLLVPYCGDYLEANRWSRGERAWYEYYLAKRERNAEIVADNVAKKIEADAEGTEFQLADFQQFDAGGLEYREEFVKAWLERQLPTRCAKSGAENVYRNLALNPDDIQGDGEMQTEYPHAVSNSEYAYLAAAAAKNAIDGDPETSWTPNLRTDAWLNVDFGHEVEIDKIVVQFAEGVDKESSARTTTVEFSDGSTETIKLMPTSEPQAFTFDKRRVVRVRLVGFVEEELPPTSFSVAELEVWGVSVE
jgi:hypothetical protein